jgi:hypothetical protein
MGQLPNALKASWPTVTKEDQKTDNVCDRMYQEAIETGEPIPTTAQRLRSVVAASWPTPDRNMDSGGRTTTGSREGKQQISLNSVAHSTWPTPQSYDDGSRGGPTTPQKAKDGNHGMVLNNYCPTGEPSTWGTPQSASENPAAHNQINGTWYFPARGILSSGCLARTEKFVVRLTTLSAWFMGYTVAYLAHWETASFRKSQQKSLGQSS